MRVYAKLSDCRLCFEYFCLFIFIKVRLSFMKNEREERIFSFCWFVQCSVVLNFVLVEDVVPEILLRDAGLLMEWHYYISLLHLSYNAFKKYKFNL